MFYTLKVIPPIGKGQYYHVDIEAPTGHDATQRVERMNPGCQVSVTNMWDEYDVKNNSSSSYSSSTGDIVGGVVALVGLVGWTLSTTWAVTKWAAPKVWKGCEITSNGVEWLLTNTR